MSMNLAKDDVWRLLRTKICHNPDTGCWQFIGFQHACGYWFLKINGVRYRVHRLSAYVHLDLDINNPDIQVNHTRNCPNKDCINPDHLYIGTQQENVIDSVVIRTHKETRKTHCPMRHPYDEVNTRIYRNMRYCRACKREGSIFRAA